jgi:hypothetical protein
MFVPRPLLAGVDDILEAIRESEFRFARATAEVPFIPTGWMQYSYYPHAEFEDDDGVLPTAGVAEHTYNVGAVMPVHVAKRDMLLLGGDITRDDINVRSGPYQDQRVLRITPVAAWLHQFGENETVGAFVAPILSRELASDQPWASNGFAGVIGMHWYSDTLQWLYGGVYEYNFGEHALYPYVGLQWLATPKLSLSLVFPWPTISYAATERWLFQAGVAPGGSSWIRRGDGFESTQTFGSWNASAGAAYRMHGKFWLYAGVGAAGFRGLTIKSGADETGLDAQLSPVYTLAIQFRP